MEHKTFVALGLLRGEMKRHLEAAQQSASRANDLRQVITILQHGKPPSTGEQVSKPTATKWEQSAKRTPEQRERMSKAQKKSWKARRTARLGKGR